MSLKLNVREVQLHMARRCITQYELAASAGVSCKTLSKCMHGKALSPATLGKISAALECDPSEISSASESR